MSPRLTLALETGELVLPPKGVIAVISPVPGQNDLRALAPDRLRVVAPFYPHFRFFSQAGHDCVPQGNDPRAATIICLPRAKAQARAMVHDACAHGGGLVVVDGNKTDGIESLYRDIRRRAGIAGQLTKAHGRIFWFRAEGDDFADWIAPREQMADGYRTAPGVFSADAVDPASAMLAAVLPERLGRHVVDLGAGWGFLADRMLTRDARIETLDLVEADHAALACARQNVTDPRARFHWADALNWPADGLVDAVVMNPPFHTGRAGDPALGRGFVATAARILAPGGILWMVANRHLPYEAAMGGLFSDIHEVGGDKRFKLLRATRPVHARRGGAGPARSRRSRAGR